MNTSATNGRPGVEALADAVVDFSARRSAPLQEGIAVGPRVMTAGADEVGLEEVDPNNFRCEVAIANDQGLHMRPAGDFAAIALTFESDIYVHKGNQQVDGKAPMDLLTLAAEFGERLVLEARGPDAKRALTALAGYTRSGFPERKSAS